MKEDTKLLEELTAKKEILELETLKKFLHDNGMTTEEMIRRLTSTSSAVHEQKLNLEDRKNVEH